MTLQVAMLGRDGWVLASDTKGTLQGGGWVRQTYQAQKILYRNGVASAVYGDESAMVARQEITDLNPAPKDFDDPAFQQRIAQTAKDVWEREFKTQPISQGRDRGIIFMAVGHKTIWNLAFGKEGLVRFDYSRLITGDPFNPVIFLSERYYQPDHTVSELAILAAHIVVQGRRSNSMVDGLELITWCNGDVDAQWRDASLYEKKSEMLDQDILELVACNG
jgi:hypothetical protein